MEKKQTGKAPVGGNAESWRALIAAQSESGMSIKTFCASEGINPSSYYRWRKLLAPKGGQGFSPIELEGPPLCGLVVTLPGGLRLNFSSLPPASYLRSLSESFNTVGR